jgi:hypothetical protein
MFIPAGVLFLAIAAGSAEAQCFDCVQESGSDPNRPNLYCRPSGNDFSACTTTWETDPITCKSYSVCSNTYACTTDPGDGDFCSNSSCDSNQKWEINSMQDMYGWYCYHYANPTYCNLWR